VTLPLKITIPQLRRDFEALLAQLQAPGMNEQQLRAQYQSVLAEITNLERTKGAAILDAKMRVAFQEQIRFQAKRLVETEIRREYAKRLAEQYKNDPKIKFLQWTLSPDHPREDICDYLAGVDQYRLGGGVYPKAVAPLPPAHPFCRCMLLPFSTKKKPKLDPDAADKYFTNAFAEDQRTAARIAGSRDKLARVLSGEDPIEILNENRPDDYKLSTLLGEPLD